MNRRGSAVMSAETAAFRAVIPGTPLASLTSSVHRTLSYNPTPDSPCVARWHSRGRLRGFTLTEMLAVVILIGILAAVAAPVFIRMIRDGRINRIAMHAAEMYRLGRARALGKGGAVLVRWEESNWGDPAKGGVIQMREAKVAMNREDTSLVVRPATGCLNTDWTDVSVNSRKLLRFDQSLEYYEPSRTEVKFYDPQGNAATFAEICFTPRGRAYINYTKNAPAFVDLTGVPHIEVKNKSTNFIRKVFLPPNGATRLEL